MLKKEGVRGLNKCLLEITIQYERASNIGVTIDPCWSNLHQRTDSKNGTVLEHILKFKSEKSIRSVCKLSTF